MSLPQGMSLSALEPCQISELSAYLAHVFKGDDGVFLDPELLRWKYFQPRPDVNEPRSWVLRDNDGAIVAHLGWWPLLIEVPTGAVFTWHGMDWAASVPKSGRAIFDAIAERTKINFSIGGTEMARSVIPRLGFGEVGRIDTFALSVRPWKQVSTSRPVFRPKRVQSLVRNQRHARTRPSRPAHGWSATRLDSFEPIASFFDRRDDSTTQTVRSVETLNYMLSCPCDCSAYAISHGTELAGYVLFSHRWGQTRIAELRITSDDPNDWSDAYALAIELAKADPKTCEIASAGSSDRLRQAMIANGFHPIFQRPVWMIDKHNLIDGSPPMQFQASDSDAFFIGERQRPYMT